MEERNKTLIFANQFIIFMVILNNEHLKIMNDFDKKNRSVVMNLLTHRFGIPEFDAEDILQDAWLLLMEKLTVGTLPDVPERLLAYMLSVCDKKAREYLRKRAYEHDETSLDDDTLTAEKLDSIQNEIQSWVDFIEEQDRAKERKTMAIEKAIMSLKPRQRALLKAYYIDRMTMRELAEQLGYSSEDVAKNTKKRIIKQIRANVQQQERADSSRLSPAAFLKRTHIYYNRYREDDLVGLDVMTLLSHFVHDHDETGGQECKRITSKVGRNLLVESLGNASSDAGKRVTVSA